MSPPVPRLVRLVVVGTGTGVGKTHVAQALVAAWRSAGVDAIGLKPVETGVRPLGGDEGGIAGAADWSELGLSDQSDQAVLDAASGLGSGSGEVFHVKHCGVSSVSHPQSPPAPYRFVPPISPHLAARQAGVRIDLARIRAWVDRPCSSTVVESAGGLFSPLGPSLSNFDLARALEPAAWVLVAPDRLGVLHDLAATLGYARALGRTPDAIVLSQTPGAPTDASRGTNGPEISALGLAALAAVFPCAPPSAPATLEAAVATLRHLGLLSRPTS